MKMVFALLQLGIKYQIDYVRDEAISVIKLVFPPSYDEYMENDEDRVTEQTDTEDAVVVINLAWKHGLHSLLPGAFLACTLMLNQDLACSTGRSELAKLSPRDLKRCLDGREILQFKYFDRHLPLANAVTSGDCSDYEECREDIETWWSRNSWSCIKAIFELDFDPMEEPFWIKDVNVCESCHRYYEDADRDAREVFYHDLADIFDLKNFMQGNVGA